MSDNVIRYENMRTPWIIKMQEFLLIAFIVLSPIYKCLEEITIAGYNIITIVIGAILVCYLLNFVHFVKSGQVIFYSLTVLFVFLIELLFFSSNNDIGWILSILLYVCFLQTDKLISVNKLYNAFLISSIFAAFFSLSMGLVDGEITRAATFVDGSIAPIAIVVILFWDTDFIYSRRRNYGMLKIMSMISSIIVIALGMSRARFLIVLMIFIIFGISRPKNKKIKKSRKIVLYLIAALIFMIILLSSSVVYKLFEPIIERFFNEGLDSMGRDVESKFGLKLFKNNLLYGGGWGKYTFEDLNGSIVQYDNHSAYIAVLARGGLLMALPTFLSYYSLLKNSLRIRKLCRMAWVLMLVFLLLSYGNAGMFNYTICSIIPLVVLNIKKELCYEN